MRTALFCKQSPSLSSLFFFSLSFFPSTSLSHVNRGLGIHELLPSLFQSKLERAVKLGSFFFIFSLIFNTY